MAELIKVHITSEFLKSFKKLPDKIKKQAARKDDMFRKDVFNPILRTHKLKGALTGYWAYSVNNKYRVLFRFINSKEVIYYDIGTHDIYK